ncbi:hypothetical protein N7537_003151 [Penicillium hordei]|uniref:Alcohol dehydrogenase-like N-terminal domain-containing protein n=1 Tax=Penicillium hordei TaxID=40994 RepID=A0AAD6H9G9_9EURO|nr:uncharacterized protein N7537_003151 [Penicillium hordei]KAJ5618037.1 hypothetical protein N7537_003151 [Penicillium hordei]
MTSVNRAAWIPGKKVLSYKDGDSRHSSGQVVIKNTAVAIKPFDWVLQYASPALAGYIKNSFIFSADVAGEVVEVGPDVERFRVGDQVCGSTAAIAKRGQPSGRGSFPALYGNETEHFDADEQASILGLGLGTAAYSLFHPDYLGLDMPQIPAPTKAVEKSGLSRTVIITGPMSRRECGIPLLSFRIGKLDIVH